VLITFSNPVLTYHIADHNHRSKSSQVISPMLGL